MEHRRAIEFRTRCTGHGHSVKKTRLSIQQPDEYAQGAQHLDHDHAKLPRLVSYCIE